MEQLETELLAGMDKLPATEPFPDEVFYRVFEIDDIVQRSQYLEALRTRARELRRIREFDNIYKAFVTDYIQRMKQTGNRTCFTDQAMELDCGVWDARDTGITQKKFDSKGIPFTSVACPHPILPVEILKNVDTNEERVTLDFFKYGEWQSITVDKVVCANSNKIVDALSPFGIEVTSENKDSLVRYLSDCFGNNPVALAPKKSINRLGWVGYSFTPYANDIRYEGDRDYEVIFRNIKEQGDFETWKNLCKDLRKNIALRMMMAASFASVLLEPLNVLPFVLHVWGTTGTCKTVALMVAMSIWGNPKMGGLVKTMNMTKNAIMRNAAFLCSIPLAGDELQTIKDKWNGNFDQLIYQITEGVDRGRAKAHGGVEETKTWKNSILFTGEEPITKTNSGGGSKNRVIEIAIDGKLVEDGHRVCSVINENYGFAGKKLVEYIQQTETKKLTERYRYYFDALCQLDTTDKQAMAMSCILLADELSCELIFSGESPLEINDVKKYLHKAMDVDIAERALEAVMDCVAKNKNKFSVIDIERSTSPSGMEIWGSVDNVSGVIKINKSVLCEFLDKNGFDYTAVSKKWAERNQIRKNSQGRYIHNTKVNGIKSNYIYFENNESEGFIDIEEYQMELPFE